MKTSLIERENEVKNMAAQGYAITRMKSGEVIAIKSEPAGPTYAKAWAANNSGKRAFYYRYNSREKAETYCKSWLAGEAKTRAEKQVRLAQKQEKRARLKASDFYQVGDCLYTSWGYDQTNVDFYQVLEVKAKTILIREILANSSDNGGPTGGRTAPRRFEFSERSKPITCRLNEYGNCCVNGKKYMQLSKWEGLSLRCSSYA